MLSILISSINMKFIVVLIYHRRSENIDNFMEMFKLFVVKILDKYPEISIFIVGDFNSRIGDLNNLDIDSVSDGDSAVSSRTSLDTEVNTRGRKLIDCFEV